MACSTGSRAFSTRTPCASSAVARLHSRAVAALHTCSINQKQRMCGNDRGEWLRVWGVRLGVVMFGCTSVCEALQKSEAACCSSHPRMGRGAEGMHRDPTAAWDWWVDMGPSAACTAPLRSSRAGLPGVTNSAVSARSTCTPTRIITHDQQGTGVRHESYVITATDGAGTERSRRLPDAMGLSRTAG